MSCLGSRTLKSIPVGNAGWKISFIKPALLQFKSATYKLKNYSEMCVFGMKVLKANPTVLHAVKRLTPGYQN